MSARNTRNPVKVSLMASFMACSLLTAPVASAQSVANQVTLPLKGEVDVVIDWGSANANATCTRKVQGTDPAPVSCTYDAALDGAGPFNVRISGSYEQFGNGDTGYPNADKITRVTRFGSVGLTSLSGAFNGAERLTSVPADLPETVTDLSFTFKGAVLFNDENVRNWGMRTRNVTNMTGTFEDALLFSRDLDTWCMKNLSAPPARFTGVQMSASKRNEVSTRVGQALPSEASLTQEKEPLWGQCGVTFDATPPAAAQAGAAYSLDLRSRATLWSNAPGTADRDNLTFSVVSGSLPNGLSLNASTGVISGTPDTPGTYNFTIRAVQN